MPLTLNVIQKKVLCSAEKSSVIWAKPHSRSSAEQFCRTERSVDHQKDPQGSLPGVFPWDIIDGLYCKFDLFYGLWDIIDSLYCKFDLFYGLIISDYIPSKLMMPSLQQANSLIRSLKRSIKAALMTPLFKSSKEFITCLLRILNLRIFSTKFYVSLFRWLQSVSFCYEKQLHLHF